MAWKCSYCGTNHGADVLNCQSCGGAKDLQERPRARSESLQKRMEAMVEFEKRRKGVAAHQYVGDSWGDDEPMILEK